MVIGKSRERVQMKLSGFEQLTKGTKFFNGRHYKLKPDSVASLAIQALKRNKRPMTMEEIATEIRKQNRSVTVTLDNLVRSGRLRRVMRRPTYEINE